ncbi:Lipopolysaccharide core heptose(I) kinase RfaP [Planctomycetes bacterium Poly30]|uniref:Lipopolysaccharide core heptose(I) kinase RfaP n=1 Tax=Saltatorellus ferox TaxID=2528018 RepID=A0A518EQ87_9BACT|nr:Lipopolysaccharide core heptose(I) kinase RfaP [Planctomycetes bacterium Poly30]
MNHWTAIEPLRSAIGEGDPYEWLAARSGETFREKGGRRTFRFDQGGQSYFAKLASGIGVREALKELTSLRTPPLDASREAHALQTLRSSGVAAPTLIGWGVRGQRWLRRRSFLVTEDVGTQRTLGEVAASLRPGDFRARRAWIRRVARLVAGMHAAGVNHRDLYFGHLLVRGEDRNPEIVLIDLHRAQVWTRIPERWLAKDLGALGFAAQNHGLSRTDLARFVRDYAGAGYARTIRSSPRLWRRVSARVERTNAERARKGERFGG